MLTRSPPSITGPAGEGPCSTSVPTRDKPTATRRSSTASRPRTSIRRLHARYLTPRSGVVEGGGEGRHHPPTPKKVMETQGRRLGYRDSAKMEVDAKGDHQAARLCRLQVGLQRKLRRDQSKGSKTLATLSYRERPGLRGVVLSGDVIRGKRTPRKVPARRKFFSWELWNQNHPNGLKTALGWRSMSWFCLQHLMFNPDLRWNGALMAQSRITRQSDSLRPSHTRSTMSDLAPGGITSRRVAR